MVGTGTNAHACKYQNMYVKYNVQEKMKIAN